MILTGLIVGLVSILGLTHLWMVLTRDKNLPPGPIGLPILGYYLSIKKKIFQEFFTLKKKYGNVVMVYIGRQRYVLLNTYEAIKEAFITKGDNFSGRAKQGFSEKLTRKSGILVTDGPLWQEHRRFSLRVLKDFGFGRNVSEQTITDEYQRLFVYIDNKAGQPIDAIDLLLRTVSNVICTMTLGEQPGYEDEDFKEVVDKIRDNIKTPGYTALPFMYPNAHLISGLLQLMFSSVRRRVANIEAGHDYIRKKITAHREALDYNGEPHDFTDAYLMEQRKMEESGEPHTFTEWQLIRVIFELFIAGTDTTSNSLAWGIFWLAYKPEIQRRVHKEIDENVDRAKEVTLKDKKDMHYVQAVLDEIQRWASIVPTGVPHRNFTTDTIQGYTIPANTIVIGNVYGVHHDPSIWEKPEEFYPEHFLTSTGEYRHREELIPFLIGRRACLGETLAKMEYFVFFVSIMRRYSVSLEPSALHDLETVMTGTDGIIRSPGDHKIIFKLRE